MEQPSPIGENSVETVCESDEERCGIVHQRCCHNSEKPLLTEDRLRRKLQFFFMNPIEKWHAKKRFPFKFVIQVVKIVLVTMQLCLFAYSSYNHVNYTWDNRITFSHLFLREWDAVREVNAYPPAIGPLAIYEKKNFFSTLDYAYDGYFHLDDAVGSYSYANEDNTATDMVLCLYHYKKGIIFGFNESYVFNSEVVEKCLNISRYEQGTMLNSRQFLEDNGLNISFSALVRAKLMFSLKTVNFKAASRITAPNCYKFDITILFDNEDHDGQMLLSLDAEAIRLMCKGANVLRRDQKARDLGVLFDEKMIFDQHIEIVINGAFGMLGFINRQSRQLQNNNSLITLYYAYVFSLCIIGDTTYITDDEISTILRSILNYTIILTCICSLVLCSRAVWRAQQLKKITILYFKHHLAKELSVQDKSKFLNYWYIMIIVNDMLIIMGSSLKEQIEREEFTNDHWNVCSLFLGVGNMLVWFGVLRYLGFFKTYNVVILTLQKAAPQVARFLLCALLIYAGFTFCGWLILGPYHLKFRSLSTTSECLFSLINGDDMFATFSIMSNKSNLLWWFCRVYLYSFISLYIYVILSLFISVIMDAYETIKLYYSDGFPKSDLENFIGNTNCDEMSSGIFRSSSCESLGGLIKDLCCCCPQIHKTYRTLSRGSSPTESTQQRSVSV